MRRKKQVSNMYLTKRLVNHKGGIVFKARDYRNPLLYFRQHLELTNYLVFT